MESRPHRRNAEFSIYTKQMVLKRAQGKCEWPTGCDKPHNGRIDHITGCKIGYLLGMDKRMLRSVDNAQTLCKDHDILKTELERRFVERLDRQLRGYYVGLYGGELSVA